MTEKKLWTRQEDQILKFLKEQQNLTKWSEIARKMKLRFGKNSRNQKQCRDRYINHLRVCKENFEWGKEEQQKMIELHRQFGNKWAAIADQFNGITENFIKNQFYSRLRKSIRKVNKFISQSFRRQFKQFKLNLIFKLASIVDGKLKKNHDIQSQLATGFSNFLYILISYTQDNVSKLLSMINAQQLFVRRLIQPLLLLEKIFHIFNKKNKKRNCVPKLSSIRFSEEKKIHANQSAQTQNQFSQKLQLISFKANQQLHITAQFYKMEVLGKLEALGQPKTQELVQKMRCEKNQETDKNDKTSVSETQEKIKLEEKNTNQSDQNFPQKQNNVIYEPDEGISQIIQEQSQILEILYEQSPRSLSFIVDNWNNSEQSEIYTKWED